MDVLASASKAVAHANSVCARVGIDRAEIAKPFGSNAGRDAVILVKEVPNIEADVDWRAQRLVPVQLCIDDMVGGNRKILAEIAVCMIIFGIEVQSTDSSRDRKLYPA